MFPVPTKNRNSTPPAGGENKPVIVLSYIGQEGTDLSDVAWTPGSAIFDPGTLWSSGATFEAPETGVIEAILTGNIYVDNGGQANILLVVDGSPVAPFPYASLPNDSGGALYIPVMAAIYTPVTQGDTIGIRWGSSGYVYNNGLQLKVQYL